MDLGGRGEQNDGFGLHFCGLKLIIGGSIGFCCGKESAGKYTGASEEDDCVATPYSPVQILRNFFLFFRHNCLFQIYYCAFIILITIKRWWGGWGVGQ